MDDDHFLTLPWDIGPLTTVEETRMVMACPECYSPLATHDLEIQFCSCCGSLFAANDIVHRPTNA